MSMRTLSIKPYYATKILLGEKTIEVRSWQTPYRGDILIHASSGRKSGCISEHAICVAKLWKIEPLQKKHGKKACWPELTDYECYGQYAWHLKNLRLIKPFELKGKLNLWTYDGDVELAPEFGSQEKMEDWWRKYYEPLFYYSKRALKQMEQQGL